MIVTVKSLRGFIAQWAVAQSPYARGPEGLADVLEEVTKRFDAVAPDEMMGTKYLELAPKRSVLQPWLEALLFDIPQVQAWNQRKNGREGLGFTSMHSRPAEPDDDFIDLYALVQNIATSLLTDGHECSVETNRLLAARGD